jgi:hypothetical protein
MRVVRIIMMVFGAIFLVVIALFAWLMRNSAHFKTAQEPFAQTFLADFSKRWDVSDVYSRAGTAFIEQTQMPQGQHWLSRVSKLGHLRTVRDVRFSSYTSGPNGQSGVFTFRSTFENGEATVTVTVYSDGQTSKVLGLFVTDARLYGEKRITQSPVKMPRSLSGARAS